MIAVIDPSPSSVRCSRTGAPTADAWRLAPEEASSPQVLRDAFGAGQRAFALRLVHGGDAVTDPVSVVDDGMLARLEAAVERLPAHAGVFGAVARALRIAYPSTPLYACTETAFFNALPDEERGYAIPDGYAGRQGARRHGFHGLFHQAQGAAAPGRVLSIVLDVQTTVCGLVDGRPRSVNLGFSPLEGVLGRTTCGDLDPGIVFYLMRKLGYSVHAVDDLLKNRSGFFGLTGLDLDPADLFKLYGKDERTTLAFDVFGNQLLRCAGEALTVLRGLDAVVVGGRYAQPLMPLLRTFLLRLGFLGVHLGPVPWTGEGRLVAVSTEESRVCVLRNAETQDELFARLVHDELAARGA